MQNDAIHVRYARLREFDARPRRMARNCSELSQDTR